MSVAVGRFVGMKASEVEFRNLVRKLLAEGRYPSPTAINKIRGKNGKWNVLGSEHTCWRREELEAAGFRRIDSMGRHLKNPKRRIDMRYSHPDFWIAHGCIIPKSP